MNNTGSDLLGQLFVNQSKDGKVTYLRGRVNGVEIVAFKNKDGKSFRVLPDTRKEEGGDKADFKKGGFGNKGGFKAAKAAAPEDLF